MRARRPQANINNLGGNNPVAFPVVAVICDKRARNNISNIEY
jgi:hypothetical protein